MKTLNNQYQQRINYENKVGDIIIYGSLIILTICMVFPFYNMLLISFAKYKDIIETPIYIYPKSIDFENYKLAVQYPYFSNSVLVSVFVTVVGTFLSIIVSAMGAYVLSRKNMPFRKGLFYFTIFTMYFGAGLIPWYLVMKELRFIDSIWAMIIPPLVNTFYVLLLRNYFMSIPESLEESAKIDGANDIIILFRIILPVAAPVIATITLFYTVDRWNEWWLAMILIQDRLKHPLQFILRKIIIDSTFDLGNDMQNVMRSSHVQLHTRSLQMATVTITTIPIVIIYPMLQKHFTKGIMLGAIKE